MRLLSERTGALVALACMPALFVAGWAYAMAASWRLARRTHGKRRR